MKRFLLFLSFILLISWLDAMSAEEPSPFLPRVVKIQNETEVDSLAHEGVEIMRRRGDILLCLFPNPATRSGMNTERTRKRIVAPTLDVAKEYYNAGSIQNGKAAGIPLTGKGVVVGLCDIGIDPLHPTFLDSDGRSRIKRVVQYVEHEGIRRQLDGDDAYREWVTDNPDEYHATHVCGILAGGGAASPYAGIASEADIVATVSTLTEVGLLAGVEDIIDYAKEVGKPAVINISVGSYVGPHDGSSLFSQYLDMCADEAVIVLSAGNEGSQYNTLITDFSPSQQHVAFRIGNTAWDQYKMYGVTDVWSGSETPLTVTLGLYDSNDRVVSHWLEPMVLNGGESRDFTWTGTVAPPDDFPFEGELTVIGGVDSENGRHCTTLGYDFSTSEMSSRGVWARYELAVKVSGNPGDEVEVYTDGIYSRLAGLEGVGPGTRRTISDLACGYNVISVGMYGNRDSVPVSSSPDGPVDWVPTGYKSGETVIHSSYGTLRDGRVLPLTVAPGATLMSAGSRPYFSAHPEHPHLMLGGTSWTEEGGTSMSAPYVAGYIATWLEAVPTLTSADIKRILAESNRTDIPEPDDPHNATGYFDPVKGLQLALQSGGVEDVQLPGDILLPDEYVEAYDVAGIKRYAGAASGLSGIKRGLYLVKTPRGVAKRIIGGN